MDYTACLAKAAPPQYGRGTEVAHGRFVRNIEGGKKKEERPRYPGDTEPPEHGYRLRPDKWRWENGLSVNQLECLGEIGCSLQFHPEPSRYSHVATLDLQALVECVGHNLIAIYDPIDGTPSNPCHFNIVPPDVSLQDFYVALRAFVEEFPPTLSDPEMQRRARNAAERHKRCFTLILNVTANCSENSGA